MRKSGLYTAGVYIDYTAKSFRRRLKRQRLHRAGKGMAAALLAMAVGAVSMSGLNMYRDLAFRSAAEPAGSLSSEEESGLRGMVPGVLKQERNQAVYPEDTVNVIKEPGDILVVLDPGHGGMDDGCVKGNILEKDINLQIAGAVSAKLQEMGYQVMLTRNSDRGLTLEERVKTANDAHADIYVSIHQNSSEVSSVEGIEVWYSAQNAGDESAHLSELIRKYTIEDTGAVSREIREEEELYVIRECTMPSCLVETGFLSNQAERGRLTNPEYQEQIAEGIASGIDFFFQPKTMYLTFDDGPSEENTSAVLDILKERNIKATFFVVGENVAKHPEVARRIVEEGHTIGIHCNNHEYKKLYASVDSYLEDFEEAQRTVKEVTGVEAKLFRFPGGSINDFNRNVYQEIAEAMTERGYIYYDWNASLEDAVADADPETLIQNAVSSTLGRRHVVMLAHDVVYETSQCLEELLDQFPEYRMEPLTEDLEPIQFR